MKTVKYFDGKTYAWVGLSRQKSILGKVGMFPSISFPFSYFMNLHDNDEMSLYHFTRQTKKCSFWLKQPLDVPTSLYVNGFKVAEFNQNPYNLDSLLTLKTCIVYFC